MTTKNLIVLFAILSLNSLQSLAADTSTVPQTEAGVSGSECTDCKKSQSPGLQKTQTSSSEISTKACDTESSLKKGGDQLQIILKQDASKSPKPKEVLTTPTSRTANSVTYKFPEKVLNPGESLYFVIPADMQDKAVNFVVLGHRQDPTTEKGMDPQSGWDALPGLTSVQIHAKNFAGDKTWRYWRGMASGDKGAKFAEVRTSPEIENLYEWQTYGSGGVDTGDVSNEGILPDGARIVSMGKDSVKVSELTIKVLPPSPAIKVEKIFTAGSAFSDTVGEHPQLGGGQNAQGKFPGAVVLGSYGKDQPALPDGWKIINGDTLSIPLPKGKILTSVEVLGGDSHPDGIKNKDGGWGTPGWAKGYVGIQNKNGTDWFVENENIPPEGVLVGTPRACSDATQDGDHILIRGVSDTYYVMAVRIGLKDP